MAMSQPQEQCPIQCQLCEVDPMIKWKCLDCDLLMCSKCKDKIHSKFKSEKEHKIIDIKDVGRHDKTVDQKRKEMDQEDQKLVSISGLQTAGVSSALTNDKLINVKQYQTEMLNIHFLGLSVDGSLWIGDGAKRDLHYICTSLQNVQLLRDKVTVISRFNMVILGIAVTPSNDILMATGKPRLMQIKAGSNRVSESVYCEDMSRYIQCVHASKDGRVIMGGGKFVVVMDTCGKYLTRYENDKNKKPIFKGPLVCSITSTSNGNIFIIEYFHEGVVMLGKGDVIDIYTGNPVYNYNIGSFNPISVVTTPMDNVLVADNGNHTLHILDNNCQLLTVCNIRDIGIKSPASLAIIMEGPFPVLYIGCHVCESNPETGKLFKMNIMEC
ncbi:Hypothetical predicted protein [Mytilus galloprovincialis]|uniref:B box-type domain-containing protein n=1 Tax=Mytilus galloprovincialis TaxID=29158 RepID=A0A8B6DRH3_MYTGA|nr:Hypothetical predicted protein [Mytilus galloprovincialis]